MIRTGWVEKSVVGQGGVGSWVMRFDGLETTDFVMHAVSLKLRLVTLGQDALHGVGFLKYGCFSLNFGVLDKRTKQI